MTDAHHDQIDMNKLRDHLGDIHQISGTFLLSDDDALEMHQHLHTHSHIDIRKDISPHSGVVVQ